MAAASLSDEQLVNSSAAAAAAAAKKKRAAAAAAKKKRYKKNKAAAKRRKTKRMVWPGSGFISLIMMMVVAFGSVATSLIHQSDASGENNSPALPKSRYLRHKTDHSSNYDIVASTTLPVVVPPPILAAPTPTPGIRRMTSSDKLRASTCLDTPHWSDIYGYGCDDYEKEYCLSVADLYEGDMGPATKHCCKCGGGSTTVSQIHSFGLKLLRYIIIKMCVSNNSIPIVFSVRISGLNAKITLTSSGLRMVLCHPSARKQRLAHVETMSSKLKLTHQVTLMLLLFKLLGCTTSVNATFGLLSAKTKEWEKLVTMLQSIAVEITTMRRHQIFSTIIGVRDVIATSSTMPRINSNMRCRRRH